MKLCEAIRLGAMATAPLRGLCFDTANDYFQINTDEERLARALQIRAEADKVITEIATKGANRR